MVKSSSKFKQFPNLYKSFNLPFGIFIKAFRNDHFKIAILIHFIIVLL